jgi:hypothetical protein
MERLWRIFPAFAFAIPALLSAQTAEELVAKNLQAKGGMEKIKAIRSLRMTGRVRNGSFTARIQMDSVAPDRLRQSFTIQGMTQITAYDGAGSTGWQIEPFGGRRDPEAVGEDQMRGLVEQADFYGPLVDYEKKGNTIAYLGHDLVDGDDAYRLKVTLKNGDIYYYYLDPDTFLEIRLETVQFIRGSVRESLSEIGSYKKVAGVYFPFSVANGSKDSSDRSQLIFDTIEANIDIPESQFKLPADTKAR